MLWLFYQLVVFLYPCCFAQNNSIHHTHSTISSINSIKSVKTREPYSLFSGVYIPDLTKGKENYAGAWLATVETFQLLQPRLDNIIDLEGASFFITEQRCSTNHIKKSSSKMCTIQKTYQTVLTRDYFDFQVEHLSSTTKYLETFNNKILHASLKAKCNALKKFARNSHTSDKRLRMNTIAVISISVNPVNPSEVFYNRLKKIFGPLSPLIEWVFKRPPSKDPDTFRMETRIRFLFFKATFWSVYRVIPHIVVTYRDSIAKEWINNHFAKYIWKSIDLTNIVINNIYLQPKITLQYISYLLKTNISYQNIKYIYYTESDHILHIRNTRHIMNILDSGNIVLSPHRMETYLLPQMLREKQRMKLKEYAFFNSSSLRYHAHTNITTLNALVAIDGSCCDNGRIGSFYPDTYPKWPYFTEEGLRNVSTWLQFTYDGFTFPTITEHQGLCTYSKIKTLCPIPQLCSFRVPIKGNISTLCTEIMGSQSHIVTTDIGFKYLKANKAPPVILPIE